VQPVEASAEIPAVATPVYAPPSETTPAYAPPAEAAPQPAQQDAPALQYAPAQAPAYAPQAAPAQYYAAPSTATKIGAGSILILVASILLTLTELWSIIQILMNVVRYDSYPLADFLRTPSFLLPHLLGVGLPVLGFILWRNKKAAIAIVIAAAIALLYRLITFSVGIMNALSYVSDIGLYLMNVLPLFLIGLLAIALLLIGGIVLLVSKPVAAGAPQAYTGQPGGAVGFRPGVDPSDRRSGGYAVLGFFIPLVGLILFLMWKDGAFPQRARSAGKGALIGVIVNFVLGCVVGFLSVILATL
jgi:hypothetical protein